MKSIKPFREVQTEWYDKLKAQGFEDIENTNDRDRPLKESASLRAKRFQIVQEERTQYQRQVDDFLNSSTFKDACKAMVKHGNCKFTYNEVCLIWEKHVEGQSRRQICRYFGRSIGRINDIIWGLEEWMKLV